MHSFHPDIIPIRTGYANTYLIRNGSRSVLVDTGLQKSGRLILARVAELGLKPSDIRLIILTHPHYDHCMGARALIQATGAQLLVHRAEDSKFRKGYCRLPMGATPLLEAWVGLGRLFMPWLAHFPAVAPDIVIDQATDLGTFGIKGMAVHTPGHSNGSLTVIFEAKHAIAGDTVIGGRKKTTFPPFVDSPKTLLESWKMLIDQGIEYLYPGHGRPFRIEQLKQEYQKRVVSLS